MASPLQKAINQWIGEVFGRDTQDSEVRYEKLMEENLELAFAWETELKPTPEVRAELGDVYLSLLAFAESLGLDLEKMGADKLKDLKARTYERNADGHWIKVANAPANAVDVTPPDTYTHPFSHGRMAEDDCQ